MNEDLMGHSQYMQYLNAYEYRDKQMKENRLDITQMQKESKERDLVDIMNDFVQSTGRKDVTPFMLEYISLEILGYSRNFILGKMISKYLQQEPKTILSGE